MLKIFNALSGHINKHERTMNILDFESLPIIGILRGISEEMVAPITATCINSGLKAIEVTMNTPNAPTLISKMVKEANGKIAIGAGTVLSVNDMHNALNAGASFIVQPTVIPDIIVECVNNSIPVFPGALTPTEIQTAWELGATMVKVFPVSVFGAQYLKEVKGPLHNVKLLACGGINAETIGDYFRNGASAAAFGASIFNLLKMNNGDYEGIGNAIKNLIYAYNSYKETRMQV